LLKGKGRSFVLVLVLLAVLALVGCGSSETKVTADEVVQDALAAQADVDSSSVEITIDATADGMVNGMDINVTLDGSVTGTLDWVNKKMQGHVGMNVGLISPMTFATQVTGDMYAFDNISYIQMTMMGSTDNWTKASLPVDFWYTQENEQSIENLLQAAEAESLPSQKVGGVDCYVLQLNPDYAAIQQMLNQQADTGEEVPDIASLISNLSIKVWVAKDTSYLTKIEVVLAANIPSEVLGGAAGGEGLAVSLTVTMQMTDVNEPVSIELPDEAQNAEWGNPLDMLSGFGFGL
jgi:hypothetical protein